jgi:hypothetical protein
MWVCPKYGMYGGISHVAPLPVLSLLCSLSSVLRLSGGSIYGANFLIRRRHDRTGNSSIPIALMSPIELEGERM